MERLEIFCVSWIRWIKIHGKPIKMPGKIFCCKNLARLAVISVKL